MKKMGICVKVLTGKKHVVHVSGQMSSEGNVDIGVPQGSSIGPLLFLILILDIDDCLKFASATSFADDIVQQSSSKVLLILAFLRDHL